MNHHTNNRHDYTTYHTVSLSRYGHIFRCSTCSHIHIEFGSVAMNLSQKEYIALLSLVENIDPQYCEEYFSKTPWKRKIQIQLKPTYHMMAFTREELQDFRELLNASYEELTTFIIAQEATNTLKEVHFN